MEDNIFGMTPEQEAERVAAWKQTQQGYLAELPGLRASIERLQNELDGRNGQGVHDFDRKLKTLQMYYQTMDDINHSIIRCQEIIDGTLPARRYHNSHPYGELQ